jgi:exosome complex exonuclease DIS3/RRP44
VLEDKAEDPTDDAIESEDETEKLLHDNSNKKEKQPTGKVVGIIKRKWRQYCGIIQPNILKGSGRHIFIPAEKNIRDIRKDIL